MKKYILISIFSFLTGSQAWAINYFRCDKDSDCAKTYGGCGRYEAVHKRYKELYEAKARKSDTIAFCHKPKEKDYELAEKGVALCKKNRCHLILPKNE
ncbi:MAG: hypothetical protein KDD33_07170 [Bdellovibrionales bacterium]|nr:hypothetical protein [Bdellovibrionales bacterium]